MALTAQAQKIRQRRLTGTRIAAIVGLSKHKSPIQVWRELVEGADSGVDPDSPDILRGEFLEPGIRAWYRHLTGLAVHKATPRVHPTHGEIFAAASDAFAGPSVGAWDRVVEIKAPRYADDWGESGTDQIPEYYVPQISLEMACADLPRADIVALLYGEPRIYTIDRDLDLEGVLIEAGLRFWRDHVETGRPPPVDATPDYGEYIAKRFASHGEAVREADAEAEQWAAKLREAKAAIKGAEAVEQEARNHLQALIGDAAGIKGAGWSVSWKTVKGRSSTDWEALARSKGVTEDEVKQHTKQGDGYRRFVPKFQGA